MENSNVIEHIRKKDCDFIVRKIGDQYVLISVGKGLEHFNGSLKMNDTGLFLWNSIKDEMDPYELVELLVSTYGIEEALARTDVNNFLNVLFENDILEGVVNEEQQGE